MKAVRYLRVSSAKQAEQYGLHSQTSDCERSERQHGLEVVRQFEDVITGFSTARPGLTAALDFARAHNISVFSFPRVDRVARGLGDNVSIVFGLLEEGFKVYSADMGLINHRNASSVLNYVIRAGFSHVDATKIRENTTKGMHAKAKRGRIVRQITAYGWRDNKVYEPEAAIKRRIWRELAYDGVREIAHRLNQEGVPPPGINRRTGQPGSMWRPSSIWALTETRLDIGLYEFGRSLSCRHCGTLISNHNPRKQPPACCGEPMRLERHEVAIPAQTPLPDGSMPDRERIITDDEYERAIAAIERRRTTRSRRGRRLDLYPLTGRITCGLCGGAMSGAHISAKQKHPAYYCASRKQYKAYNLSEAERCQHATHHRAHDLHDAVRERLEAWLRDPALLHSVIGEPQPQVVKPAENKREELQKSLASWAEVFEKNEKLRPMALERMEALQDEIAQLPPVEAPVVPRIKPESILRNIEGALLEGASFDRLIARVGAYVTLFPDGRVVLTV